MSFLEKYRPQFQKEKVEAEQKDNKQEEEKILNPFIEDKLNKSGQSYDGNKALEREQWLENADLGTIKLLSDLHKKNSVKYSKANIARVLSTLDDFKSNHDFDIRYVTGTILKTRLNLFPPTIKEKIIDDILSGKIDNYDEKYLTKIIQGEKDYLEKIKYTTKRDKENYLIRENNRKARVSNFEKGGTSKQENLTTECPALIIETHADSEFSNGALENINQNLPQDINRQLLRINYQEGVIAKENELQDNTPQEYQEITDRSGEIGEEFLKHFIKSGEKANIVLTGGNLRGCLSSSIESIINSIEKNKPEQVDINIPLDKVYDDDSYDQKGKFPTDLLKSKHKLFVEIYKDGNIVDVSSLAETEGKTRVRLFLWSKTENFSRKLKDSLEIKKIRESISSI
ncbi:hypothetical protein KJ797_00010 [Patescibacteria group bacterium]|nr:hypothetical protein [Patescibacteria group bacterium]